jgi:hypothetical protein
MVTIEEYGNRFWCVLIDNQLLAVVVYKRGATAIKTLIESLTNGNGNPK